MAETRTALTQLDYVPFEFSDPDGVGILKINAGSVKEADLALMGQPYWGGMFQTRDWVCPTDCWLEFGYRFPEAPWGSTLDGLFGALWCLGNSNGRPASRTYLEVDILEQIGRLTGRQGAFLPMGIWEGTSSNDITKYKVMNDFNQRGLYGPWSKVGIDVNAAGITFWHNADMFGLSASDNANGHYASFARNPKFLIANMSSGNGTALVQGQPPAPGKAWFNNRITPLTWQQGKCLYLDYIDVWVPTTARKNLLRDLQLRYSDCGSRVSAGLKADVTARPLDVAPAAPKLDLIAKCAGRSTITVL